MATHARQSRGQKRILASTVTLGALAAAGDALTIGPLSTPAPTRTVSMPIVLVDHSTPWPDDRLLRSCAITDLVCTLAGVRGVDSLFAAPTVGPAASATRINGVDPLIARLLGAPAQILANPLNVIGRGGWLIGDAVRPGGTGGTGTGTNGQDGADG
jgi:hypothetical protein